MLVISIIFSPCLVPMTFASNESSLKSKPVVIKRAYQSAPVKPHISNVDLRNLPKAKVWNPGDPIIEIPRHVYPHAQDSILGSTNEQQRDPLIDLREDILYDLSLPAFSTQNLNFDGQAFSGVYPSDTVGEIGPDYYIQMINGANGSNVTVYDKTNGSIMAGPLVLDTLWTAGGACQSGLGDPIVLYDTLADRWLLSEFAASGNHLCMYISQTPDPISGGRFLYDFAVPQFPDYPKYAVWPDAYYISTNEGSPAAYALDRAKILNGQPATAQRFTAPGLSGFPFEELIPGDIDGTTPPPAGSPNYFMRHNDGEVHGNPSPGSDTLEIWEFHVDWNVPANSSFTGPANIMVSEFDSDLCGLSSFECFPQPGTGTRLDPLREVTMHRLQYRNFGTHESLDGNDHGGIRWFELRKVSAVTRTLSQEGTYAPDQAHRWMGSIAMGQNSNIARCYSVSSPQLNIFPSIRYAGRLQSDPIETLPQGEFTLIDGAGPQTGITRWGDYSSMNVDPVDDCTFWYTNEYVTNAGLWQTRIGSFKFDSCSEQGNTVPDIKANGSDGPVQITSNDTLSSTVALNSGVNAASNADWWVVAVTLTGGLFHYDAANSSWLPSLIVTHQGPLFDLATFSVLNISDLPVGTYTLFFGIDMNMNGSLDLGQLFLDNVVVINLTIKYMNLPCVYMIDK